MRSGLGEQFALAIEATVEALKENPCVSRWSTVTGVARESGPSLTE
jgi:hypothetical protein